MLLNDVRECRETMMSKEPWPSDTSTNSTSSRSENREACDATVAWSQVTAGGDAKDRAIDHPPPLK